MLDDISDCFFSMSCFFSSNVSAKARLAFGSNNELVPMIAAKLNTAIFLFNMFPPLRYVKSESALIKARQVKDK
jgi:hypothetical protein